MGSESSVFLEVLQNAGVIGVVVVMLASGFVWVMKKLIQTLEAVADRYLKQILDLQHEMNVNITKVITTLSAPKD
jgi:predicted PurR-regulated permease PerM